MEDLEDLDEKGLRAIVKEHKLDVDPEDFEDKKGKIAGDDLDDFRKEIAEELGIEEEEEEEDDDLTMEDLEEMDEDEDDDLTMEDLEEMDEDEIVDLIKEKGLKTKPSKYDDEDELREAVAEELGLKRSKKKK